ncbi:MAG: diguanylate cyclase, partial [Roseibium sp.]|nr:diguanylate cyclase [Roseibium sp.]
DREFLGEFVWAPALPGSRLLPFLGLGMLLVFLAMFFAARLFFRRAAETVNALENAKNDAETARELLADQARTDPLTELGNRRHLDERIEYLENHSNVREHGLLYLDLDRFKQINDTYGHEAGDKVLRHVALALKTLAREDETIVRMGGDEFVIIFENALRQRVLSVGRTILEHLGEPFEIDGAVYRFGASIGIAFSEVPSELLRQADVALYSAKRQGRGQMAVYTSDLLDLDNLPIETSA